MAKEERVDKNKAMKESGNEQAAKNTSIVVGDDVLVTPMGLHTAKKN